MHIYSLLLNIFQYVLSKIILKLRGLPWRWGLWWGNACKVRWTTRVNRMRLMEHRRHLILWVIVK